ncbi:hypothetical protein KAI92_01965 [Candidatus Parcubacteria bacterium]|nr:hypothetical protein [Candidatus Parcubacteria bacterium]
MIKDDSKERLIELYKEAINRYSAEITNEDVDDYEDCEDEDKNDVEEIKVENIPF